MTRHKIVWNDLEQALLDPKGEGHDSMDEGGRATRDAVAEDARSNLMAILYNLRLPQSLCSFAMTASF